jgi:hypothetical protein
LSRSADNFATSDSTSLKISSCVVTLAPLAALDLDPVLLSPSELLAASSSVTLALLTALGLLGAPAVDEAATGPLAAADLAAGLGLPEAKLGCTIPPPASAALDTGIVAGAARIPAGVPPIGITEEAAPLPIPCTNGDVAPPATTRISPANSPVDRAAPDIPIAAGLAATGSAVTIVLSSAGTASTLASG